MKKLLTILLSSSLIAGAVIAQSLDFTTGFSIDPNYDTMGSTVSGSGITFSGLDNQVISGVWGSAQDLSAWSSATEFHVLGSISTAPTSLYSVALYDSSFNSLTLSGGEWGKIDATTSSVDLTVASNSFAWNDIVAIDFNTGGAGSAVAGTLTSITVVPEPSTAALLAGMLALGSVMLRRRAA